VDSPLPEKLLDDEENSSEIIMERLDRLETMLASQNVKLQRSQERVQKLQTQMTLLLQVMEIVRQAKPDGLEGLEDRLDEIMNEENSWLQEEPDEDENVFGDAPADVLEAADSAGSSILSAVLAGKQRLLVDVRDADLANNPAVLTQFVELACLPVAAGLEGLQSTRNRLKIVFPTVPLLLHYRQKMTLSAPDVISLSTLGFDPVEDKDNLVVVLAPEPDDEEGWSMLNALLSNEEDHGEGEFDSVGNRRRRKPIRQPIVVLNYHMLPITGPAAQFEVAYHLRLLQVQYMASASSPLDGLPTTSDTLGDLEDEAEDTLDDSDELVAAMEHARKAGAHQGSTRAMVIRGYPKPWHVFVDVSPSSDADFQVAATFVEEPSIDVVNMSIVECLEGSEQEDEIVAQQMQEALETGQLDNVSELLGGIGLDVFDNDDEDEEDEDEEEGWRMFGTDSV